MGVHNRAWFAIGPAALACVPGVALRFAGVHPPAVAGAAVFGLATLSAAFLLSWSAETVEMDISQGLAQAIIAIIAVLPDYAVDFVPAQKAGADPVEAERELGGHDREPAVGGTHEVRSSPDCEGRPVGRPFVGR